MELDSESSKSLRSMSDLTAEIESMSFDAYNAKVVEAGAEDILARWWRREMMRSGKVQGLSATSKGNNRTEEGLYEKIRRRYNEVRRARLLRNAASKQPLMRAAKHIDPADASGQTPDTSGGRGPRDIKKVSFNLSVREVHEPSKRRVKVTEESSRKALNHGQCSVLAFEDSPHFGFPDCIPSTKANVHLVVSAFDSKIAWLSDVQMPMTIYVHNRSANRGRCISNGQKCVAQETPQKLHEAAESQRQLLARSKQRPKEQQIKFFDVPNIGDEALGYLMYIVGNWERLPDFVFFTHDHQCSWHSKFDMTAILARAQQCMPGHHVGYKTLNDPDLYGGQPACFSTRDLGSKHDWATEAQTVRRLWPVLFTSEFGRLPPKFCMDCCAQFVVSRELIHSHPLDFYKRALNAVKTGRTSFEYFWRTLFIPHFA